MLFNVYCLYYSVLRHKSFVLFENGFPKGGEEIGDTFGEDTLYKVVIIYTIFILVFTVLPIFMIVLIGVSNCISFGASSRKWHLVQKLAITLDRRCNITTLVLLALMLVHFTRKMSEEIDVGNNNEAEEEFSDVSLLVSDIVHLVVDVMMIIFPLLTACVLGRLCCCFCLKKRFPPQDTQTNTMVNKMI